MEITKVLLVLVGFIMGVGMGFMFGMVACVNHIKKKCDVTWKGVANGTETY